MLVYRFMSKDEYEKLIRGEKLKNDWVHDGHTDSIGFCFMPYKEDKPEDAYRYLSGIVSPEVCVVFSTSHPMKKGYGIYADWSKGWGAKQEKTEYSTTEYSLKDFKIEAVCFNFNRAHFFDQEWIWNIVEV